MTNVYHECTNLIDLLELAAVCGHVKFYKNELPQDLCLRFYMAGVKETFEKCILDGSNQQINKIEEYIKTRNDTNAQNIEYFRGLIKSYFRIEYMSDDTKLTSELVRHCDRIFKEKYYVLDRKQTDKQYYIYLWPKTRPPRI